MLIRRSDRGLLANWWFTVDKLLLTAVLLLMAAGVMISMAASPPVAERIGVEPFHFFKNQLVYLFPAAAVLIAVSFLGIDASRRAALWTLLASFVLMLAALRFGPEIKGAQRWIEIGPLNVQPSELAKPAFVVMVAWFLAERTKRPDMPGQWIALGLAAIFFGLLIAAPDFGQAGLMILTFMAMLLVWGISWIVVFGLVGVVAAGVAAAYFTVAHVNSRIQRFIDPDKGDTFQVDTATQAFNNGGVFGAGPGGGEAKLVLPDAHTDFTFAVVGEEFGLIACIGLMALFAFITIRILIRAAQERDPFPALAMSGLAVVFGLQSIINIGVNVSLLPAKGMTLPFISYGGSSLVGMAFAMGLALAFARRRPAVA